MTPEQIVRHPIVAGALAAHGATPDDVMRRDDWKRGDLVSYAPDSARTGLIHVHVSRIRAQVDWDVDYVGRSLATFHIRAGADGFRASAECLAAANHYGRPDVLPDQMLAALTGKPFSAVLDVPGADAAIIAAAAMSADILLLTFER